jgi:hypothetical protein
VRKIAESNDLHSKEKKIKQTKNKFEFLNMQFFFWFFAKDLAGPTMSHWARMASMMLLLLMTVHLNRVNSQSSVAVNAVVRGLGVENYNFVSCDAIPFHFEV